VRRGGDCQQALYEQLSAFIPLIRKDKSRAYLKTPNAPGQRAFLRCAASFFLEIRQYSCEKMSCATQKSLAAGHIMSFQIRPRKWRYFPRRPTSFYNRPKIIPAKIKSRRAAENKSKRFLLGTLIL
jgi:hypothetical protein